MKSWYNVTIRSFDPHNPDLRWKETVAVYAREDNCTAIAFRQINRPSVNVHVYYSKA